MFSNLLARNIKTHFLGGGYLVKVEEVFELYQPHSMYS